MQNSSLQHNSPASRAESQQPVVLLVEDHDGYRQMVCMALYSFLPDWQVLEADSLASGSLILRKQHVDVLVCDMTLPDGVALDLAGQRVEWFSPNVRVIIFSNYSTGDLELLKLRTDIHAYLTKDQGLKQLAQTIRNLAD